MKLELLQLLATPDTIAQFCCEFDCRDTPRHCIEPTKAAFVHWPVSVELDQPQTVTLDHLSVEVGRGQYDHIVAGGIKGLHTDKQRAAQQHSCTKNHSSTISTFLASHWSIAHLRITS